MGSINPFEKIVPAEQPHEQPHEQPREEVIITPKPEEHPYDPAMVGDLIKKINNDEQDEEDRVEEIERGKIKPTLQ
jgi:hypothetical protein